MSSSYAAVGHWREPPFDEGKLESWAREVRARLKAPSVTLGLLFTTPRWFDFAEGLLEIVRLHSRAPLLAGCSSTGLIAGAEEAEGDEGIVLALYYLPEARLDAFHFTPQQVAEGTGQNWWAEQSGVRSDQTNGWLVFADPFQMDSDLWLRQWNQSYEKVPTLGGLASGDFNEQRTHVYLNGEVHESGGVAVSVGGGVGLSSIISQGCTPFGETWTITKAEGNLIQQIGNRAAYEVLVESFNSLPEKLQKSARGNLFIGLAVNEYLEEFHQGDFLIRNLLGADPSSGIIAVGAAVRPGQTMQFQRRDAEAATQDLRALLVRAKQGLAGRPVYGGCLCSCNGRGARLFGQPHHDAMMVQEELGPLGLSGFFCNGELGPVGERNFLHGYTASTALFVGAGGKQN